jgi:hypothetical protein
MNFSRSRSLFGYRWSFGGRQSGAAFGFCFFGFASFKAAVCGYVFSFLKLGFGYLGRFVKLAFASVCKRCPSVGCLLLFTVFMKLVGSPFRTLCPCARRHLLFFVLPKKSRQKKGASCADGNSRPIARWCWLRFLRFKAAFGDLRRSQLFLFRLFRLLGTFNFARFAGEVRRGQIGFSLPMRGGAA